MSKSGESFEHTQPEVSVKDPKKYTETQRPTAFYWIKYNAAWQIALWNDDIKGWFLVGAAESEPDSLIEAVGHQPTISVCLRCHQPLNPDLRCNTCSSPVSE